MGNSPKSSSYVPPRMSSSFELKQNHKVYNEMQKDMRKLNLIITNNSPNLYRQSSIPSHKDILFNLPKELKAYSTAIQTVGDFWLSQIDRLPQKELEEVAEVIYCKLFLKCKHIRSTLLLIPKHTIKIVTTFGYIIKHLIYCKEHTKMFKQLQSLGMLSIS